MRKSLALSSVASSKPKSTPVNRPGMGGLKKEVNSELGEYVQVQEKCRSLPGVFIPISDLVGSKAKGVDEVLAHLLHLVIRKRL